MKLFKWIRALPWAKALKAAMQVVVPAAVGSAAAIVAGCADLTPSAKTQSMSLYAIGIPGIAVVTRSEQMADNKGDDDNKPVQVNTASAGK